MTSASQKTIEDIGNGIAHTFWGSLGAVRLHRHVRVQMVERAVRFFAAIPPALVHALYFFISAPRSLVLLRAGNRNKRIHGRQWVTTLAEVSDERAQSLYKRGPIPQAVSRLARPCRARQERPSQARGHTLAARNGHGRPTRVARTLAAQVGRRMAACGLAVDRASIADAEDRLGSRRQC